MSNLKGADEAPFIGVKVYRATAFTLTTLGVLVAWDAEEWDTSNFHDPVTNPERLTVPTGLAGKYSIKAGIRFSVASAQGRFILAVLNKGAAMHGGTVERSTSSTDASGWSISLDAQLAVADYLTCQVYLDTAAVAMDIAASGFSMTKIG